MRRKLIWGAIVFGAIYYVIAFFVGEDTTVGEAMGLSGIGAGLGRSIDIVATIALGLGVVNLFYVHGANIWKRRAEWPLSLLVFATFATVVSFLVWEGQIKQRETQLIEKTRPALNAYREAAAIEDPQERSAALASLTEQELAQVRAYYAYQAEYHFKPKTFYLESVISPLAATVMALLGFYITYAAYRAFRVRSLEATVMMLSAAIMIIGSDAIGGWCSVTINWMIGREAAEAWLVDLPFWADFDNRVMMSGMQRGLWIGISIAIIAASLRMLLGFERGVIEVRSGGDS